MRKSGPFRSIKLCACRFVGADSDEAETPSLADNVPEGAADTKGLVEAEGSEACFVDRKYQASNSSETNKVDRGTARRARMQNYSRATVVP